MVLFLQSLSTKRIGKILSGDTVSKIIIYDQHLTELVLFFVEDQVQFVIGDFSLFKLFIQEVLIQSPRADVLDNILNDQEGIFSNLQKLKDNFPEINQQLSPLEILRIFLGPMIVYIFQSQLFQAEVENYHQDLELIKRQIIFGLKA